MGELEWLKRLQMLVAAPAEGMIGIGDDCAGIPLKGEQPGWLLLTCDAAVEDSHFVAGVTPWWSVGWRLATANVSDVVACGGVPQAALISLGAPHNPSKEVMEGVYQGLRDAAAFYGFSVVGGNMTQSATWFFDCTMFGQAPCFIKRSGVKPGDYIAVSSHLGDGEAGRKLFNKKGQKDVSNPQSPLDAHVQSLVDAYLKPLAALPQLSTIQQMAHAAIDISDGLGSELHHLSTASSVRIDIRSQDLPCSEALSKWCQAVNEVLLPHLLKGGEGYQALISLDAANVGKAEQAGFVMIGQASNGSGVWLDDAPLLRQGWEHF